MSESITTFWMNIYIQFWKGNQTTDWNHMIWDKGSHIPWFHALNLSHPHGFQREDQLSDFQPLYNSSSTQSWCDFRDFTTSCFTGMLYSMDATEATQQAWHEYEDVPRTVGNMCVRLSTSCNGRPADHLSRPLAVKDKLTRRCSVGRSQQSSQIGGSGGISDMEWIWCCILHAIRNIQLGRSPHCNIAQRRNTHKPEWSQYANNKKIPVHQVWPGLILIDVDLKRLGIDHGGFLKLLESDRSTQQVSKKRELGVYTDTMFSDFERRVGGFRCLKKYNYSYSSWVNF